MGNDIVRIFFFRDSPPQAGNHGVTNEAAPAAACGLVFPPDLFLLLSEWVTRNSFALVPQHNPMSRIPEN